MFKLKKKTDLPNYNGSGYLYAHDRTGMEIFHVKNDSTELSACFMFATPSEDSTGVAHILEHTVLSGSGLYPVKDPFSEVYNSSPNTFLNAMTYTDKTVYPFASPLKKDFDILFSIYADAVFNPLLRKESFEQEGIRFFDNHFDGVVFNEMIGAMSDEDAILQETCLQKLYEGTAAQYVSGGDPRYIPDLTYEQYLARYRKWYSPSNCRLFLFGDLEVEEYMEILEKRYLFEENLSKWELNRIVPNAEKYPQKSDKPTRLDQLCSTEDAASTVVAWLTKPASDPLDIMTISLLADILIGGPGSPLYDAIIDSELGEDMSPASGVDSDFPLMPFIVGFTDVKKGKDAEVETFILDTLKKIVSDGLDKQLVDGVVRRQEFKIQEIPDSGVPLGIMVALKAAKTWLRGNEPDLMLLISENLEKLKQELSDGPYFENWIRENLIENTRRCLVTIKYSPDYEAENKRILEQKLQKRISLEDPEQFEKEKAKYTAFTSNADSPEALAKIPRVTISDLPEKIPLFEVAEKPFEGANLIENTLFTNGITYVDMAFDIGALTEDEYKVLPLLVRLLQMCGTKKLSFGELSNQFRLFTGSFTVQNVCGTTPDGKCKSVLYVKTKVLNRYLKNALELIEDLITEPDFTQERIKASLTDLITDFESSFHDAAYYFAALRASAVFSKTSSLRDVSVGIGSYLNLLQMKGNSLKKELEKLERKVFNKKALTVQLTCDEDSKDANKKELSVFLSHIPSSDIESNSNGFSCCSGKKIQIIKTASGPAYNCRVFNPGKLSDRELALSSVLTGCLANGYLWDSLRTVGGAYGAMCNTDTQESLVSMASYRDPNIAETYAVYSKALEQSITQEEIDHLVVTLIGKELKPMAPQTRAQETLRRHLFGMTDSMYFLRRKAILGARPEDLTNICRLLQNGHFTDVTICSKEMKSKIDELDQTEAEVINLPI